MTATSRSASARATAATTTSRSPSSSALRRAGTHIAFAASSPEQVDAFHAAALAAGGSDNGAPGLRPYGGEYYAAFVLDPDGHNIEAVYHGPADRRE
jgi:catechol 2,3-dioxygenase-like lactoylglutathione lyase family enzyme